MHMHERMGLKLLKPEAVNDFYSHPRVPGLHELRDLNRLLTGGQLFSSQPQQ